MHELGIVLNVIDRVEEIAKENNVKKVTKLTLEKNGLYERHRA